MIPRIHVKFMKQNQTIEQMTNQIKAKKEILIIIILYVEEMINHCMYINTDLILHVPIIVRTDSLKGKSIIPYKLTNLYVNLEAIPVF